MSTLKLWLVTFPDGAAVTLPAPDEDTALAFAVALRDREDPDAAPAYLRDYSAIVVTGGGEMTTWDTPEKEEA